MFAQIAHEIPGRIRFATGLKFSPDEANALQYQLSTGKAGIDFVRVYQKTGSVTVGFEPEKRSDVIALFESLKRAELAGIHVPLSHSMIIDENEYPERLTSMVMWRTIRRILLPRPLGIAFTFLNAIPFIVDGIKTLFKFKLNISVLDATAILFSLISRDFKAASEITFLLKIGEVFEEWTERKSAADLAKTLMNVDEMVWVERGDERLLVPLASVEQGEHVIIRMGYTISIDGQVVEGEGQVNQSSLTGESLPVKKGVGDRVYAGTSLEEGELIIVATTTSKETRLSRIMDMIDDASEQKSSVESRVTQLADSIVPYNLAFGAGVGLLTRNLQRTSAAFVVDYSCALKLATSISVLSAMREGAHHGFTIKGGKQLEHLAEADTIVFDKTGTLTQAKPKVTKVVSLQEDIPEKEILRFSACLEEHFPHPVATAIVQEALKQNLAHRERHAEVEYIVAHGIVSSLDSKRVLIGSPHFVFDDENVPMTDEAKRLLVEEAGRSSVLFLAIGGNLAGAIIIEDPIRPDAKALVDRLRQTGFTKIVMLTGDAEAAAQVAAEAAGVDEYRAQMLPEDKAKIIAELKKEGRKVVMVGDGVNDSLALATAHVGIAMNNGADVARQVADITLNTANIQSVVLLRLMSKKLFKRLSGTYGFILAANSLFLGLGVFGLLGAGTSALLHNGSTIGIALSSMRNLYGHRAVDHLDTLVKRTPQLKEPRNVFRVRRCREKRGN